jgi:hypothetical protein
MSVQDPAAAAVKPLKQGQEKLPGALEQSEFCGQPPLAVRHSSTSAEESGKVNGSINPLTGQVQVNVVNEIPHS